MNELQNLVELRKIPGNSNILHADDKLNAVLGLLEPLDADAFSSFYHSLMLNTRKEKNRRYHGLSISYVDDFILRQRTYYNLLFCMESWSNKVPDSNTATYRELATRYINRRAGLQLNFGLDKNVLDVFMRQVDAKINDCVECSVLVSDATFFSELVSLYSAFIDDLIPDDDIKKKLLRYLDSKIWNMKEYRKILISTAIKIADKNKEQTIASKLLRGIGFRSKLL